MTRVERERRETLWTPRVQEFRQSGLSGVQWCAARGLSPRQLHYWNRKLHPVGEDAAPDWVVLPGDPPASASADGFDVTLGGATITVRPGFNAPLLQHIVRTLSEC